MASASSDDGPAVEYVFLGNSGLKVSNICLGTMTFASDNADWKVGPNDAHKILDRFAALGGNFIDTANVYQGGCSEEIVGSWLKKQNRDRFVVATKVRFPLDKENVNGVGLSRKYIMAEVEGCLKRLNTPYIDLLQVHCWDEGTPLEETMGAIKDLVQAGKVHYFGVSNFVGWQLQKISDLCREHRLPKPISLQSQYSLLCRWPEWELNPVCENEGIGLMPWSPLKGGWLTGKFKREEKPASDSRVAFAEAQKSGLQSHPTYSLYANDDKTWALLDGLAEIAKEHDRSVAQVSLRWLLQQRAVDSVVIGARKMSQLEDNMAAAKGWKLSEEQMAKLDALSAVPAPYPYEMVYRLQNGRRRN